MKLLELTIENFRGFKRKATFNFHDQPGLYFMQGRNDVEPRLGSNGAGKSSVWEAIHWLIRGNTSRGLKAGAVGNWSAGKGTVVSLAFEAEDGSVCEVTRTWKPNSWTMAVDSSANVVDLTKHPTNPFLAQLRLDEAPFLNSVLMAQGEPMFLDLKPEPQAALFSEVLGLDKWLKYSADASKRATEQDRISRRLETQLAELRGQILSLDSQDLFLSAVQWKEDRDKQIDELDVSYKQGLERSRKAKARMEDAAAARGKADERKRTTAAKYDAIAPRLNDVERRARKVRDDFIAIKKDLEHAVDHRNKIAGDEACPTCGRAFEYSTMELMEDEANAAVAKCQDILDCQHDMMEDAARELEKLINETDDLDDQQKRAARAANDCYGDFQLARQNYDLEERSLDRIEDDIHVLQEKPNPYSKLLDDQTRSLGRLREEIEITQEKLDESNSRYARFMFWVKGFKEVRLQLISEALDELEIEVNSEVMELGLVGWELLFDVDKETKSGSLSRGFTVSVLSPHNDEPVPWGVWSGGEAQRLRVGAQMGLANLIRTRTGATIDLETWDEPTKELSEEGVIDLLNALADRARREKRQIWIVDHRSHGYGGFAGGAMVIKDERGSRIVQTAV